jgi:hypothetical protein
VTVATWLAIAVLGPGALAVFAWFLHDVGRVLGPRRDKPARQYRSNSPGDGASGGVPR